MENRIFRNVCTNILLQIVLIVSGLLIPQYILIFYGSEMNGLVSSISQFITYAALIEMGVGNASIIALYKPIADHNISDIGKVLTTSKKMYLRSGCIYVFVILAIAFLYPSLLVHQFDGFFVFMMVLCIGSINAIDYFILGKYKIFLIADQKYYVLNVAKLIATVVLTIGSIIFLYNRISLLWIKAFAVLTHLGETLFVYGYMKVRHAYCHYHSESTVKIEQRWNALICQLCATIVYNTDLVVLTVATHDLLEISVYTVYNMVFSFLNNIASSLTTGVNASFGNLFVRSENKRILSFFGLYELLYFMVVFTVCSCFAALVVPFVACYTKDVHDVDYLRYEVGLLFAANGLLALIKDVSGMVINAAGRIKETQGYAIEEAVVNILLSLLLVRQYGIIGVLIGTFISHMVMSLRMMCYAAKELLPGTGYRTVHRFIRNLAVVILLVSPEIYLINNTSEWSFWIMQGVITTIINSAIIVGVNYIAEPAVIKDLLEILIGKIKSVKK